MLAENHEDNKAPIDWDDYIVCKGYAYDVVYDDGKTNFDTENLTIPKILNFMKQFSESSNGMPEREYDAFVKVFFKKNDNDIIIFKYGDFYDDDLYHYEISKGKEPSYYVLRTEEAIVLVSF